MALKPKTPTAADSALPPLNERFEEYIRYVRPEVDVRLNKFIEQNPKSAEYCDYMVKRHPERATRALMLDKMFKHEADMKIVHRESEAANQWLAKQEPSMKEWITEKLKGLNPFYREKDQLRLIKNLKSKVDFNPRRGLSQGTSA